MEIKNIPVEIKGIGEYKERKGYKRFCISLIQVKEIFHRNGFVIVVDFINKDLRVIFSTQLKKLIKDKYIIKRKDGLEYYALTISKQIKTYPLLDDIIPLLK